jgi:hypothetical protein
MNFNDEYKIKKRIKEKNQFILGSEVRLLVMIDIFFFLTPPKIYFYLFYLFSISKKLLY